MGAKKITDFIAIEMEDWRDCDYCKKTQLYNQMAMQDIYEWDLICPDCYDNL